MSASDVAAETGAVRHSSGTLIPPGLVVPPEVMRRLEHIEPPEIPAGWDDDTAREQTAHADGVPETADNNLNLADFWRQARLAHDMQNRPVVQPPEVAANRGVDAQASSHQDGQDLPERCMICMEGVEHNSVSWPQCSHPAHAHCLALFLRSTMPGNRMPDIDRLAARRCPFRGAVHAGVGIEACVQAWGDDAESRRAFALVAQAAEEQIPQHGEDTTRHSVMDYTVGTFSRVDAIPPSEPPIIAPLCQHHMGCHQTSRRCLIDECHGRHMHTTLQQRMGNGASRAGVANGCATVVPELCSSRRSPRPPHMRAAAAVVEPCSGLMIWSQLQGSGGAKHASACRLSGQ